MGTGQVLFVGMKIHKRQLIYGSSGRQGVNIKFLWLEVMPHCFQKHPHVTLSDIIKISKTKAAAAGVRSEKQGSEFNLQANYL